MSRFLFLVVILLSVIGVDLSPIEARAEDAQPLHVSWAISEFGTPIYAEGMEHFAYVNPDAPKGGKIRLGVQGTFDSLNTYIEKGYWARVLGPESDSLMVGSGDEIDAAYGLIAESVEYPEDMSWAVFNIRPEAHYADGTPITADDFVYTVERIQDRKHGRLFIREAYKVIKKAEALSERRFKVEFERDKWSMKSIMLAASLSPSPRHWWAERDPFATTLEPPLSSGPYIISEVDPGRSITYTRDPNYWGKDLSLVRGTNNFDEVRYDYYLDDTVLFEAFKAGEIDVRFENRAQRWITGYDFDAVRNGTVIKEAMEDHSPQGLRGMFFNHRRKPFDDVRVRKALTLLYDFETIQRTVLSGQYARVNSNFPNSEYAATGAPEGRELEMLEPYRDQLPPEVFGPAWEAPKSDGSGRNRKNRREALALLRDAGYVVRDGAMIHLETNQPLSFEILLQAQALERVIQPFVEALRRDGIDASIRLVDPSQFQNRINTFDFDLTVVTYTFYPPPGPLLADRYHSSRAEAQGSANIMGISDPVIDALLEIVVTTKDFDELKASVRALDRVLMWGWHAIPEYYNDESWIAYWDKFARPAVRPKISLGFPSAGGTGFSSSWWVDPDKAAALAERR